VSYWFRLHAHPDGLLPYHEFAADGELVYPRLIERGTPRAAWFEISDGFVFATDAHPEGPAEEPWYEMVGSFLYPSDGHPDGPAFEPRYQTRTSPD
jgi:hypothetical protein